MSAAAGKSVKLLLVDDNPMVLVMLKQALTPLAEVASSGDAADALLKAVDDPPDLVVVDYRMPGLSSTSSNLTWLGMISF